QRKHLRVLEDAAAQVWSLVLGPRYYFSVQFQAWKYVQTSNFNGAFALRRKSLLNNFVTQPTKKQPPDNLLNLSNIAISTVTQKVLNQGVKFAPLVTPSKLDIIYSSRRIAQVVDFSN